MVGLSELADSQQTEPQRRETPLSPVASPAIDVVMLGDSLESPGGIATVEQLILSHPHDGARVRHVATRRQGGRFYKVYLRVAGVVRVLGSLRRTPQVYHVHLADWGSLFRKFVLIRLLQAFGKPTVVHCHGPEFHRTFERLPGWLRRWVSAVFRRCERFLVLSQQWRAFYVDTVGLAPERVHVLLNPVRIPEPHRLVADPNPGRVRMVFLGRIGARKGAFDLLRAIAALPAEVQQRMDVRLGGDGEVEEGERLARELGLESTVQFLGWIGPEQRDALLAESHVFLLPSHNEGLPMALLEGMAWRLAPVSCPVGGVPDVLTDGVNGLLTPPGDVESLAERLRLLVEDRESRDRLADAARDSVRRLGMDHYMPQLVEHYHAAWNMRTRR